jgi:hypothetical protein
MTSVDPTDRPLPLGKLIVALLVLAICGLYALTTLLYVLPSNPLRIQFDAQLTAFEQWGYQKWTFFAPPPKSNDRLYIAFSPKSGEGETIEVLEGIYARKRQDNPHNTKAQVVDYVMSGFAGNTADMIREVFRYRKVHSLFDGDPAYLQDLSLKALDPESEYGLSMRVLLRYAAMLAAEQGIEPDGLRCQIAFATVPLRPFTQRYNSEFPIEEELFYKTTVLDVPQLVNQ